MTSKIEKKKLKKEKMGVLRGRRRGGRGQDLLFDVAGHLHRRRDLLGGHWGGRSAGGIKKKKNNKKLQKEKKMKKRTKEKEKKKKRSFFETKRLGSSWFASFCILTL